MGAGTSPRTLLVAGALLAIAAVAIVIAQTRSHGDQPSDVRRVVKAYEVAIMSGDGDTACAQLTDGARREMLQGAARAGVGSTCAQVAATMRAYIDRLIARAPSPERAAEARRLIDDPPVDVVALDGGTATARISGVANHPISLVKDGSGWKIDRMPFTEGK